MPTPPKTPKGFVSTAQTEITTTEPQTALAVADYAAALAIFAPPVAPAPQSSSGIPFMTIWGRASKTDGVQQAYPGVKEDDVLLINCNSEQAINRILLLRDDWRITILHYREYSVQMQGTEVTQASHDRGRRAPWKSQVNSVLLVDTGTEIIPCTMNWRTARTQAAVTLQQAIDAASLPQWIEYGTPGGDGGKEYRAMLVGSLPVPALRVWASIVVNHTEPKIKGHSPTIYTKAIVDLPSTPMLVRVGEFLQGFTAEEAQDLRDAVDGVVDSYNFVD